MIPHAQKSGVRHQNHVSIIFRNKVRNLLLEVVPDLLHPILDLQVNLRLPKVIQNDPHGVKFGKWLMLS